MRLIPLFAFAVLCCASGCEGDSTPAVDVGELSEFFPTELGKQYFYDVDSITLYNEVGGVRYDTVRLEARETLVETFVGADGTEWFRGERWERKPGQTWQFRQTYALSRTSRAAFRREENLQFTKLTLPLTERNRWDGHADFDETRELVVGGEFLDVYANWSYVYEQVSGDELTVRHADTTDNFLDLRVAYEVYTKGVGLSERYVDARHTQCVNCCNRNTATCRELPWATRAEKGFILRQVFNRSE